MKKVSAIILIVLVSIGVIVTIFETRQISENNSLTQRAQEYIDLQKKNHNPFWEGINFSKIKQTPSGYLVNVGCFSLTIPMHVIDGKLRNDCSYQLFTDDPITTIAVYKSPGAVHDLNEDSGVKFRRLNSTQYIEKKYIYKDKNYVIFKKDGDTYENVAYLLEKGNLYVISMVAETNQDLDPKFLLMLNSVKTYN